MGTLNSRKSPRFLGYERQETERGEIFVKFVIQVSAGGTGYVLVKLQSVKTKRFKLG